MSFVEEEHARDETVANRARGVIVCGAEWANVGKKTEGLRSPNEQTPIERAIECERQRVLGAENGEVLAGGVLEPEWHAGSTSQGKRRSRSL